MYQVICAKHEERRAGKINNLARCPYLYIVSKQTGKRFYLRSRPPMSQKRRVTIYSKPGCHLCDEAKEVIRQAGHDDLFELEEVNIESDAELQARYRFEIPVIMINGVEAFRYRLTKEAFIRRLEDE